MNSSNPIDPPLRDSPRAVYIIVIIMATVCFLLGLPGNARVLIQLYKRRDLRKVPHYLFANLSATGFLALSLNLPTLVVGLTVNYLLRQWVSTNVSNATELFCNIAGTTALAVNILNAATLSLMAIDRQDCVLRPFQRRLTQRNIKKVLLAVWIMTVVLTIPSLVTRFQETSLCQFYNSFKSNVNTPRKLHTIGLGTSLSVVTVLIITITFFRIMKRLRMNVMPQASGAQQIQQRRENQITKLTYRTCAVFLVAWLPLILANVVMRAAKFDAYVTGPVRLVLIVSSNLNYVVNPFLNFKILLARPRNQ